MSADADRVWVFPVDAKVDAVLRDGTHRYWSTHCRHGNHVACWATELAPGVPRRPAQCKTCSAPCQCFCHSEPELPDDCLACPPDCKQCSKDESTCECYEHEHPDDVGSTPPE